MLSCISLLLLDRFVLRYILPGSPITILKYDDKISLFFRDEKYAHAFLSLNHDMLHRIKFFSR